MPTSKPIHSLPAMTQSTGLSPSSAVSIACGASCIVASQQPLFYRRYIRLSRVDRNCQGRLCPVSYLSPIISSTTPSDRENCGGPGYRPGPAFPTALAYVRPNSISISIVFAVCIELGRPFDTADNRQPVDWAFSPGRVAAHGRSCAGRRERE